MDNQSSNSLDPYDCAPEDKEQPHSIYNDMPDLSRKQIQKNIQANNISQGRRARNNSEEL